LGRLIARHDATTTEAITGQEDTVEPPPSSWPVPVTSASPATEYDAVERITSFNATYMGSDIGHAMAGYRFGEPEMNSFER
jgi:hypothetical protein